MTPVVAHLVSVTNPTMPRPSRIDIGIGNVISVSFGAMGATSFDGCKVVPAQCVCSRGDGLQVSQLYAMAVAAKMIELQANRKRSEDALIKPTVGVGLAAGFVLEAANAENTIAIGERRRPEPAVGTKSDLGKKPAQILISHSQFYHRPDDHQEAWETLLDIPFNDRRDGHV